MGEVLRNFRSELARSSGKPITGNRIRDLFQKSATGPDGVLRIHPKKIAEGLKFAKILCNVESECRGFGDWIHTVHSVKKCQNELKKWGIDYTRKRGKKPALKAVINDSAITGSRKESTPIPTYKNTIQGIGQSDQEFPMLGMFPPHGFNPSETAPF